MELGDEEWCTKMAVALVSQIAMYEPDSLEKDFALRAVGHVARLANNHQVILDNLSAIYLAVTDTAMEAACASAFGVVASRHLGLVMTKLEAIYRAHGQKKKSAATLFFGLLRDRTSEEQQVSN